MAQFLPTCFYFFAGSYFQFVQNNLHIVFKILISYVSKIFYGIVYPVGQDFWLFPNLFDEKLGVVDSFKPLYSVCPRTETLITRLVKVGITLNLVWQGCSQLWLEDCT